MKLLVTTNGSDDSRIALETACQLFAPALGDVVEILFISSAFPSPMTGWSSDERLAARHRKKSEAYGWRLLGQASQWVRSTSACQGCELQTCLSFGSAGEKVVSKSAGFDAVVVGTRKEGCGLGPVAARVADSASGSVLLGRRLRSDGGSGGFRILIPVDGSEASMDAIDMLIEHVNLEGAELKLMHVIEDPWLHQGDEEEWREESGEPDDLPDPELHKMMRRAGERIVEQARMRFPPHLHCATSSALAHGLPANEILAEAEQGEFDLIVMGVSMGVDLKHKMLGSVSTKVTWDASCSVLLVKPV